MVSFSNALFSPVVGQTAAISILAAALRQQRIAPAYLFAGPEGVGRAEAARCFIAGLVSPPDLQPSQQLELVARLRQGNHPDVLWVQPTYQHQGKLLSAAEAEASGLKRRAPPQIRLEQVREVGRFVSHPPLESTHSVVVLEGAETMAEAAANALLKTLEEPGQATLILLAPSTEALLPTLVSRCARVPFHRLSTQDMALVLERCGHAAILEQPEVLLMAQGSPGAAIESAQQLTQIPTAILQLCELLPATPREALTLAKQISSLEPEVQLWLASYLQQRYWRISTRPDLGFLKTLEEVRSQLVSYVQPRLVWEVTLLQAVAVDPAGHC
ncbi:DNA polymerase III subunit delta' [Leptolyngbya sp. FACHB-261]|uniref:DNA polymerase III subunit delta' n=1 Tax=Leptolyngbya sp. FACHB-261 TaxID=2692806 RepID=UPI001686D309|nr:DNA polymerase III subunit delta' [Leptolyngbya sp. FACHB-261]MBD2100504.1 DNA polymerase III subunit delta' [Leptolyngbya sp. FACHB-261]